jgi:DNA-binding XRE family transcriptional regulator
MPFLGVSHYPALDGYGEAGATRRMFIDGNTFKADGIFKTDTPVGEKLLETVKAELALIKKGDNVEKPIRISAGWWDIQHYHDESNFLFTRQSLTDKCPICEKGQTSDKTYKAGQLDHFAATRVPMNTRTSLKLEEKSMAKKITRREDAESIIGTDVAEEMENRSRMVGKSEADDELPAAMVTRADDMKSGHFMREMREKKKLKRAEVAKQLGLEDRELEALEDDEMDVKMMGEVSVALKMSDKEKEEMLARFGKKRRKEPPMKEKAATKTVGDEKFPAGDFLVVEDPEKPTTWHLQVRRNGEVDRSLMGNAWAALHKGFRGNKYEGPDKEGALSRLTKMYKDEDAPLPTEKMDYDREMKMPMSPLGGATSIKEAEGYIEAQEKMDKMYSYWDMLLVAFQNIEMAHKEEIPDKLKAVSNLFREMAGKIDTLKAGLSDAFLIQESTAAYEDYETDTAEFIQESDEVEIMEDYQTEHPADQMKAVVDQALANKSLSRADQETAVQEALNT